MPSFSTLFGFALRDWPSVPHPLHWSRGDVQTCFQVQCAAHKTSSSPKLPWEKGPEASLGTAGCPQSQGKQKSWDQDGPGSSAERWLLRQKSHFTSKFPSAWPVLCRDGGDQTLLGLGGLCQWYMHGASGMRKLVPVHRALPKPFTGLWTA